MPSPPRGRRVAPSTPSAAAVAAARIAAHEGGSLALGVAITLTAQLADCARDRQAGDCYCVASPGLPIVVDLAESAALRKTDVSQATVAKGIGRRDAPPVSKTWKAFLANHLQQIAAADFVVPTAACRLLFVLVLLSHGLGGRDVDLRAVQPSIRRSARSFETWARRIRYGDHPGFMVSCGHSVSTSPSARCRVCLDRTRVHARNHGKRS